MFAKCEVGYCSKHAEHTIGIAEVSCGVCSDHKKEARRLSRKSARELWESKMSILDKFLDRVTNIKEEKE